MWSIARCTRFTRRTSIAREFFRFRSGDRKRACSTIRRRNHRSLSLEALDDRIMLSSSPIGGTTGPIALAQSQRTQVAALKSGATSTLQSATSTSSNWSGYVAESNLSASQTDPVTAVAGSWVVPTVRGPQGTSSYSCVWVGIDGWTYPSGGGTVEQVGTEQDVINGVPRYYAWWEMYSANGARVPGQRYQYQINAMTISPGDPINASVTYITTGTYAGDFLLSIVDTSRANDSYSTYQRSYQTQNPQPLRNSAEWIVENTQENGSLEQLANFGTVTFTNTTFNGQVGPINSSQWQSTQVNMVSNGVTEASTSALSNTSGSTASFSVSFALEPLFDIDGVLYTLQNDTVYGCPAGQSDWNAIGTGIRSIVSTPDGRLWALTSGDTLRVLSGTSLVNVQSGIQSIATTPDGRLWALTSGDTLQMLSGTSLVNVQSGIQSIATTPDGRLWALTSGDTLQVLSGTSLVNVQSGIQSIATTPDGRLWALTSGDTLQVLSGSSPVNIQGGIQSIAATPDGRLWALTTSDTLQVLSGTSLVNIGAGVQSIATTPDGRLWALTSGDMMQVLSGTFLVNVQGGVQSIATTPDGRLWAGPARTLGGLGNLGCLRLIGLLVYRSLCCYIHGGAQRTTDGRQPACFLGRGRSAFCGVGGSSLHRQFATSVGQRGRHCFDGGAGRCKRANWDWQVGCFETGISLEHSGFAQRYST